MKINKWNKYYRLVIVIVGWFGLLGTWYLKITSTQPGQSVGLEILDSLSHYTVQSNITHYLTPIAIMVDWFYCEFTCGTSESLVKKDVIKWTIYPICYDIYAIIYGYLSGRYMYPFLNAPVIGYPMVFLSIIVLATFFALIGLLVVGLSNKAQKRNTIGA